MDRNQNKKQELDKRLMEDGKRRRVRAAQVSSSRGIPRVMILAGVLIVAGAAWLYWPSGNSAPTGLGEQHTVVTNELNAITPAGGTGPSSGDVDIDQQTASLTPEEPEAGQTAGTTSLKTPAASETETSDPPVEKAKVKPKPVAKKPARKPAPRVEPAPTGSYAVQIGSFGDPGNADKEVVRLKALGWDTRVRAGNNSSGQMVFRVWITFFQSRKEAQTFINQNAKHVPGAIPVHR